MMPGLGTVVNVAAILAGGFLGILLKKGISERFKNIIFQAMGAAILMIGLSGAMSGILKLNAKGGLETQYVLIMILSLVLGGVIGEALRLDRLFDRAGEGMRRLFSKNGKGNGNDVGSGFANCTILYCAGAMAIVGAVQDGLMSDPTMLIAKGMIDGITSVLFATVYGVGVPLSAVSVGLYQGLITLLAVFIKPWLTETVVIQMSLVGSIVLMLLAFNLWDMKKFNVANLIPAAFMPLFFSLIQKLWS